MNRHITKFVVALGIFMAGLLCLNKTEEASAINVKLRASPTSFDYTLNPGETISGSFKIRNEGPTEIDYDVFAKPYYTESEKGGGLNVRYDIENDYTRIASWVTFDKESGHIAPDDTAEINFTIKVPTDVPGGGQYTALLISTDGKHSEQKKEGININETVSLGPIVYAKINGHTRETGEIDKNEISGFLFNPPFTVNSIVKNTGNVHAKATYVMRVFPLFGGESIFNNEDNPDTVMLLPGTTRYYELAWDADHGAPSIGIYKVQSEIKIFDQVSKVEKTVIVCPMWVLILIIVFVLAAVFWIIFRIRARKTGN